MDWCKRAGVASRWDRILLPEASIKKEECAPPGLLIVAGNIPGASAHGLTHSAPAALEPKRDQQPILPTLRSKSTSIRISEHICLSDTQKPALDAGFLISDFRM